MVPGAAPPPRPAAQPPVLGGGGFLASRVVLAVLGGGPRRLRNEFVFSAPQLKRHSLGCTVTRLMRLALMLCFALAIVAKALAAQTTHLCANVMSERPASACFMSVADSLDVRLGALL